MRAYDEDFEDILAVARRELWQVPDRELMLRSMAIGLHHNALLQQIQEQQKLIIEGLMATQADLDAGISTLTADDAAVLSAVTAAGTATSTALTDLLAKIAANPTAPVSDFSTEVAALAQTHTDFTSAIASLQQITTQATTDDPGAAAAATPATPVAAATTTS